MLWQCYVDDHLMCDVEGYNLTSAAILSQDGSVLAQSLNFPQLKPEEIVGINKELEEAGHLTQTGGLFLGGEKYLVVQGEAGALIRGRNGYGGVTIKKTTQTLVFGIYDEPMTPGQCTMVVGRLGDYFVEAGYQVTHTKGASKQFSYYRNSLLNAKN